MGLGLLGRGVGDVEFLVKCGARVVVTDKKSEVELAESVAKLKNYPAITFKLGGHDVNDFVNCDMVLKAAGVRLDSPEIAAARAAHVPVAMSTALFAKYAMDAGARIVGVTGTRGKSTTTRMIYEILKRSAPRSNSGRERHVFLGGNVRGISTLALLPEIEPGDIAVLELDSWQLQGFGDLKISPNISVFTNLLQDHLNYYKSMDDYFADKANIFRYQKTGDALFVGKRVLEQVQAARPPVAPRVPEPVPANWKMQVIGEHNRENASFAVAALRMLGLLDEEIKAGLGSFEPVEGRLQFVREIGGVKIYNDNNATTAEATTAALRALGKNVILIAGGTDKGPDLDDLVAEIKRSCKRLVFLSGSGTERIRKEFPDAPVFDSLGGAVNEAARSASKGDTILFSPAFASFGMFRNEYDRNDQFVQLVRRMEDASSA